MSNKKSPSCHTTLTGYRTLLRTPAYPWMVGMVGMLGTGSQNGETVLNSDSVLAGHVMKLVDIVGSQAALAYSQSGRPEKDLLVPDEAYEGPTVVTASVDRTNFRQPIHAWEMILLEARLNQVWHSSMEVQVAVRAESYLTGRSRQIATSHLIFVAIDPRTKNKTLMPAYVPESPEAIQLAAAADLRRQNKFKEGRVAPMLLIDPDNDNPAVVKRQMTPPDANAQGNVFGGVILEIIDEAAFAAARKQTLNQPAIGVRLDRMSFIAPTFIGETVEARAIVTKTWQTSMEVQVEVDAVRPDNGDRRRVASGYLVYVRTTEKGVPAQVPPFIPRTELQEERARAADIRRDIRKAEEALHIY